MARLRSIAHTFVRRAAVTVTSDGRKFPVERSPIRPIPLSASAVAQIRAHYPREYLLRARALLLPRVQSRGVQLNVHGIARDAMSRGMLLTGPAAPVTASRFIEVLEDAFVFGLELGDAPAQDP